MTEVEEHGGDGDEPKKDGDEPKKEDPTCPICLESLYNGKAVTVPRNALNGDTTCGHLMHFECLDQVNANTCPVCRAPFDHYDEDEFNH